MPGGVDRGSPVANVVTAPLRGSTRERAAGLAVGHVEGAVGPDGAARAAASYAPGHRERRELLNDRRVRMSLRGRGGSGAHRDADHHRHRAQCLLRTHDRPPPVGVAPLTSLRAAPGAHERDGGERHRRHRPAAGRCGACIDRRWRGGRVWRFPAPCWLELRGRGGSGTARTSRIGWVAWGSPEPGGCGYAAGRAAPRRRGRNRPCRVAVTPATSSAAAIASAIGSHGVPSDASGAGAAVTAPGAS